MSNVSINPATEEEIARYEHISDADLSERLERSWKSFVNHRDEGFAPRALRIRKCADLLDARAREYGELIGRNLPIRCSCIHTLELDCNSTLA